MTEFFNTIRLTSDVPKLLLNACKLPFCDFAKRQLTSGFSQQRADGRTPSHVTLRCIGSWSADGEPYRILSAAQRRNRRDDWCVGQPRSCARRDIDLVHRPDTDAPIIGDVDAVSVRVNRCARERGR